MIAAEELNLNNNATALAETAVVVENDVNNNNNNKTTNKTTNYNVDEHKNLLRAFMALNNEYLATKPNGDDKLFSSEKDKFWESLKERSGSNRSPKVLFDHIKDMRQAIVKARSNYTEKLPSQPLIHDENESYMQKMNTYFIGFTTFIKSNKQYMASCWWDEDIVRTMHAIVSSAEQNRGMGKKQDANSMEEIKKHESNKYEAEQELKRQKLEAMKAREKAKEEKGEEQKEELINSVKSMTSGISKLVDMWATDTPTSSSSTAISVSNEQLTNRVTALEESVKEINSDAKRNHSEIMDFLKSKF
jgi:hypothetical protein